MSAANNNNAPTPPNIEYQKFISQNQTQHAQQLQQALQNAKIPNNANVRYTSTPVLQRTKKRKATSQEVTSALSTQFKNKAWWNNKNNTPKKGQKLTFAPDTKNGGRRRTRNKRKHRKTRRYCRR